MTDYLCLGIVATLAALYGLAWLVARRLEPLAAGDGIREDRDK